MVVPELLSHQHKLTAPQALVHMALVIRAVWCSQAAEEEERRAKEEEERRAKEEAAKSPAEQVRGCLAKGPDATVDLLNSFPVEDGPAERMSYLFEVSAFLESKVWHISMI